MSSLPAKQSTLFELERASLAWPGQPVLQAVSLRIQEGEKVALLGKSGAGKSTLLHHLYHQRTEGLAFCPQHPGLVPGLSVFHNIYMGQLADHHWCYNALNLLRPFKRALQSVSEIAEQVGLNDKLMAKAESLSGGQQQRVALARALFQKQAVFLGDEPVSAVDEQQAETLLKLIVSTHQTVVIALHNTRHALRYCDRVIGLAAGGIALDAPSSQLTLKDLSEFYVSETSPTTSSVVNDAACLRQAGCL